ncbi:MAG: succinate--CoA ligase subunit alpha [Armatimonadetes bacterium]|nr:succinate--CoA ligase subunit alpha [Armatimonadota bacterium]
MSILVDQSTKLLVQGITGREGEFHTRQMIEYGTRVVAGVTPGKGGTSIMEVPIFDTVQDAVRATGANASAIFVPPRFAPDAVLEAVDARLDVVVCITEGIPIQDMVRAMVFVENSPVRLIGPNCPGVITPGECKIGIMPGNIFTKGPVGVISRSGTLTYEIVYELTQAGLGQSTCIGIGGDPTPGTTFIHALPLFEADPETEAVVLIGEIGGSDEEIAADYIRQMAKPVVGFISGRTAPPGKRMGHAGAIVSGRTGTAQAKVEALAAAGVPVADTTRDIPALVRQALG